MVGSAPRQRHLPHTAVSPILYEDDDDDDDLSQDGPQTQPPRPCPPAYSPTIERAVVASTFQPPLADRLQQELTKARADRDLALVQLRAKQDEVDSLHDHIQDNRLLLEELEVEKMAALDELSATRRVHFEETIILEHLATEATNQNDDTILKLEAELDFTSKLVDTTDSILAATRKSLEVEREKRRNLKAICRDFRQQLSEMQATLSGCETQYEELRTRYDAVTRQQRHPMQLTAPSAARSLNMRSELSSPQSNIAGSNVQRAPSKMPTLDAVQEESEDHICNDMSVEDDDPEDITADLAIVNKAESHVADTRLKVEKAMAARESCLKRVKSCSKARDRSAAAADLKEAELQLQQARSGRNQAERNLQSLVRTKESAPAPAGRSIAKKQVTLSGDYADGKTPRDRGVSPSSLPSPGTARW